MNNSLTVFVTGATGNQGGVVAKTLLKRNHHVIALTRNTESDRAKTLENLGAELIQGSLDEPELFFDALKKVDSMFLMGSPIETSVEQEAAQGIVVADVAKEANIGHLVYSSVANANKNTGIPHFESKYAVEQHIQTLGIPFTICAPVAFMENVIAPWSIEAFKAHKIVQALPSEIKLKQISLRTLGEFVTAVIEKRNAVFNQRFDIASDEVTGKEMADILTQAIKQKIHYESFPTSELRKFDDDMAMMFDWLQQSGYNVDMNNLHSKFPNVVWQSYAQWADSTDWSSLNHQ